jgi:hypothetical protein
MGRSFVLHGDGAPTQYQSLATKGCQPTSCSPLTNAFNAFTNQSDLDLSSAKDNRLGKKKVVNTTVKCTVFLRINRASFAPNKTSIPVVL